MRNRRTRYLAGVACIVSGIPGCIDFGLGVDPTVGSLFTSVVQEGSALPEFANARGGPGSLRVSGQIVGRLKCDSLSPDLRRVEGGLELAITIVSGRQGCNSLTPTTMSYLANIYNVEPGSYSLRVEHRYDGVDGSPGERLYQTVTVN